MKDDKALRKNTTSHLLLYGWAIILLLILFGCRASTPPAPPLGEDMMTFALSSDAFDNTAQIPSHYTCDGADTSPPLAWEDPPPETQAFALIMDDPDAPVGTWVHWVLYNIPAEQRSFEPAMTPPDASLSGKNSWDRTGYGGPCPPRGSHRYLFKLYALDAPLTLAASATKAQVLQAMDGHVLATATLMGTYQRP